MPRLTKVELSLPFGLGKAEWQPDEIERKAAWSLYIELVTRISVEPLRVGEGVLREALSSLYSLFATTRLVLREAGPDIGVSENTLGGIAVAVLNRGLRPFLSKWHPELQDWEVQRGSNVSAKQHELNWPKEKELRLELEELREELKQYSDALATIAGVQND
jgi:hypothetical protein